MLTEQLVGEARARRPRRMDAREREVLGGSVACYLTVAVAMAALLPSQRPTHLLLTVGLVVAYAVVSRVRFEVSNYFVTPEQLLFVPMLLLAPLPLVPLLVAAGSALSMVPDMVRRSWSRDRWLGAVADCWFAVGPALVLAALAPGLPTLANVDVYLLALAAQSAANLAWALVRNALLDGLPLREIVRGLTDADRVDWVLSPIALFIALPAASHPATLFAIGPLVWLLDVFSRDRRERYAAALELHRAYRGTVMLLADVVEFDDQYTADHSRSVVDLVHAVADELGVDEGSRQELEFAALLHDVGKIAIPKEILNKPAALTDEEFELIKTHTIEGQFMLDRIGGLLGRVGEIIRSCHERWDGSGYPDRLAGDDIPFASRIVFACDAYHAITSDRPYRAARTREEAIVELTANAGTQFDPRVVAALTKVVEEGEPVLAPVDEVRAVLASAPVPRRASSAA